MLPLAVVFVAVVVVHHAVALLVIAKPQAYVLVIVGKVIRTLTVLLVLKPLALILLPVEECVHTVALPAALNVGAFVHVTVLVCGLAFAVGLATSHLAAVLASVFGLARTQGYLLGANKQGQRNEQ